MKKRKKQKKNDYHLFLLGIIIFIFLITVGFALSRGFKRHFMHSGKMMMTQTSPQLLLPELAQTLDIKPEIRESIYWNWIDEDNEVLPLKGSEFFLGSVNTTGVGQYKRDNNDDLSQFTLPFFQPIFTKADTVFNANGFVKSKKNSNNKPDEYRVVYGGYEKGGLKCLYNFMERSDPFGRFFCGYVDEEQLSLQKQFEGLFNMQCTIGQQPPLLRIEKVFGNAALGNYAEGSGPGGYTFMAKKINDKWQVVWRGQEIALCSDMQKYQIPKEIYGECYQQ